jgi:indole-3-glycerol phosphate synthase
MDTPVMDPPGEGSRIADILVQIVERRRERLAAATLESGELPILGTGAPRTAEDNAFLAALAARRDAGRPAVIAEVKMGSPRLGSLADRLDPVAQARLYAANGASALSVVVEPDFFGGSYELLAECRQASGLPTIAKDFVVDPLQLWWAKRAAADAVLLIAALHDRRELLDYAGMARHLGLVPLIEVHDRADLAKLAGEPWELVGVNNRDLRTFVVSLEHSESLLPELPPDALRVAESGLSGHDQIARLAAAGFDAFLIGETLLLAADPAATLRELLG